MAGEVIFKEMILLTARDAGFNFGTTSDMEAMGQQGMSLSQIERRGILPSTTPIWHSTPVDLVDGPELLAHHVVCPGFYPAAPNKPLARETRLKGWVNS